MFQSILQGLPKTAPPHPLAALSKALKSNPYRDAHGKYTSKEKAVYQLTVADYALGDLAGLQSGSDSGSMNDLLKTPGGKKVVKDIANAYYKHSNHKLNSGEVPDPFDKYIAESLGHNFDHAETVAITKAVNGSLASKKAWEKIYKDKALKGIDEDLMPLIEVAQDGTTSVSDSKKFAAKFAHHKKGWVAGGGDPDAFQAKYQEALVKKITDPAKAPELPESVKDVGPKQEVWKDSGYAFDNVMLSTKLAKQMAQLEADGVDPESDLHKEASASWAKAKEYLATQKIDSGLVYVKQKKELLAEKEAKAVEEASASITAQAMAGGTLPPKFKTPKDLADAKAQNDELGVNYYKTTLEKGKDSDEAKAAYNEWQKTKDYIKEQDPSASFSGSSADQKQKATAAFNIKKKAVAALEAAQAKEKADAAAAVVAAKAKAKDDYEKAVYAASKDAEDTESAHKLQKKADLAKKKAEAMGIPVKDLEEAATNAKTKVETQKKVEAQVKAFMGGSKDVVAGMDSKPFSSVSDWAIVGDTTFSKHQSAQLEKLSAKELSAVKSYTGSGYKDANKAVSGVQTAGKASAALVESGMNKMTLGQNLKLRRNMAQRWFWEALGMKDFAKMSEADAQQVVGKLYTEKAFSSTSKNLDFDGAFSTEAAKSGKLKMNIRAHKDIQGLDVQSVSNHGHESEVILNKGVTYVIRKVKKAPSYSGYAFEVDVDAIGHMN